MKSDAITKGYESLTNKQRAALFFQYATQGDELEVVRVLSTVPKKSYTMNDEEFIKWSAGLSKLASAFAQEHWIARHWLMASALRMNALISKTPENWDAWNKALNEVQYWQQFLLSMDAALSAVAKQHGFDLLSIYQRARTMPYSTKAGEVTADPELIAIWIDTLNYMLEPS